MRRHLFSLSVVLLLICAALLVWAWRTDAVLKAKCRNAGGAWDAEVRTCALQVTPPASPASPPA